MLQAPPPPPRPQISCLLSGNRWPLSRGVAAAGNLPSLPRLLSPSPPCTLGGLGTGSAYLCMLRGKGHITVLRSRQMDTFSSFPGRRCRMWIILVVRIRDVVQALNEPLPEA